MPKQSRSNPLALAVLVSLYERPMHPYEVAQTLRSRAKQESVRLNYGSLYATVESLERRGLIRATGTVREGRRPERTIYEITDTGATELTDWMTELLGVPEKEYPKFMAGLSFMAALEPDDALVALRSRAAGLRFKLTGLHAAIRAAQQAGLPRIFELETEYEEQMMEAELHFVEKLVKEMDSGDLDGLDMWKSFHADGFNAEEVNYTFRYDPEEDSDD
ncbi:MAG TPA: PadR family transcriptional regulator [Acidimicrobiales bacterium]|nr:PadR family transcriptional regulator [Acidimicrobiales bacterium]